MLVQFCNDAHRARLPVPWLQHVIASMRDLVSPPGRSGTTALVGRAEASTACDGPQTSDAAIPRIDLEEIRASEHGKLRWLQQLAEFGLSVVRAPATPGIVTELAKVISYPQVGAAVHSSHAFTNVSGDGVRRGL